MNKLLVSLSSSFAILGLVVQIISPTTAQAQTSLCHTFNTNLGVNRSLSSDDASALTSDLSTAGFWNTNTPITSYTDAVASAVSGFQEKYASQILVPYGLSYGTGYVGVSTRTELNSLYGCQSAPVTTTTTTQCPTGFTCTPIGQPTTPVCPVGFTCTPIATTQKQLACSSGQAWDAPLDACVGTPTSSNQPTITRISALASPDSQISSGARFAVEGTNFSAPDSVYVGNQLAIVNQESGIEQNGADLIWAVAPSNLASGSNYVTVKNSNGTSNQFTVTVIGSVS